jgi:hypothetical protein
MSAGREKSGLVEVYLTGPSARAPVLQAVRLQHHFDNLI